MRTRVLSCVLAAVLCLLCACRGSGADTSSQLQLYYVDTSQGTGSALGGQIWAHQGETGVGELLDALMRGPTAEDLRSPIPGSTTVRAWWIEKEGLLRIDLSEHYGDLTGIELTLADYCITLTMCQLEEVRSVQITVVGRELSYRPHQILTPEQAMLSGLIPGKSGAGK